MDLKELKAQAYDLLARIEYYQVELQKTNKLIAEYKQGEDEIPSRTEENKSKKDNK